MVGWKRRNSPCVCFWSEDLNSPVLLGCEPLSDFECSHIQRMKKKYFQKMVTSSSLVQVLIHSPTESSSNDLGQSLGWICSLHCCWAGILAISLHIERTRSLDTQTGILWFPISNQTERRLAIPCFPQWLHLHVCKTIEPEFFLTVERHKAKCFCETWKTSS